MTAEQVERGYLSIGDVLELLVEDFPDVTISKIRFLESKGLISPERTPSGYRRFYDSDVARLKSILLLQKEHYLPLDVIKYRLDNNGIYNIPVHSQLSLSLFPQEQTGLDEASAHQVPDKTDSGMQTADTTSYDTLDKPDDSYRSGRWYPDEKGSFAGDEVFSHNQDHGSIDDGTTGDDYLNQSERTPLFIPENSQVGKDRFDQGNGNINIDRNDIDDVSIDDDNLSYVKSVDAIQNTSSDRPYVSSKQGQQDLRVATDILKRQNTDGRTSGGNRNNQDAAVYNIPIRQNNHILPTSEEYSYKIRRSGAKPADTDRFAGVKTPSGVMKSSDFPQPLTKSRVVDSVDKDYGRKSTGSKTQTDSFEAKPPVGRKKSVSTKSSANKKVSPDLVSENDRLNRAEADKAGGFINVSPGSMMTTYSKEELIVESEIDVRLFGELVEYGIIKAKKIAGEQLFTYKDVEVAKIVASYRAFGIEPRHLRSLKHAAEREVAMYQQTIMPLLRQRNPDSRQKAVDNMELMAQLGKELKDLFLRTEIDNILGNSN